MSQVSDRSFLDVLRKSGLVSESELAERLAVHQAKRGGRIDHDLLPAELVEAEVVTAWQAKMLARGVSNGYFLGKYKLLGRLGSGGMGVVYLAEHVKLQRRAAVKVLDLKNSTHASSIARFFRESRVTAALDHPNIVRVHDFDSAGSHHYLVMEYVDGPNLQDLVDRRGPLTAEAAAQFTMQAAAGLGMAHRAGLVHRDVKPANLMVNTQGVVKVTDLGLARAEQGEGLKLTLDDGGMLGTADYISPEQAMDSHHVTPHSDVYSLGCTLYFMLVGRPPFHDGTLARKLMRHQMETPASLGKIRGGVPETVSGLCDRMLAKDAAVRPSAEEVRIVLRDWLVSKGLGMVSEDPRLFEQLPQAPRSSVSDTVSAAPPAAATVAHRLSQGAHRLPQSALGAASSLAGGSSLNLTAPGSSQWTPHPGKSSLPPEARTRAHMVCTGCGARAYALVGPNGATVACPKCGGRLAAAAAQASFPGARPS